MKNRSIIKIVHVEFDDIISFSKIDENSDDFDYATFDFSRSSEKNLITHETVDISAFDEVDENEKMMKIDNDDNDDNDEKSIFFQSRDEGLTREFENLRIDQKSKQSESSASSTSQSITSNRFFRNVFRPDYVKLNDSGYKLRNRNDRRRNAVKKIIEFSAQIDKTKDFAAKIKKTKNSVAVTYKIFTF